MTMLSMPFGSIEIHRRMNTSIECSSSELINYNHTTSFVGEGFKSVLLWILFKPIYGGDEDTLPMN